MVSEAGSLEVLLEHPATDDSPVCAILLDTSGPEARSSLSLDERVGVMIGVEIVYLSENFGVFCLGAEL